MTSSILTGLDSNAFLSPKEIALSKQFIEQGYCIIPVEDKAGLDRVRGAIAELAAMALSDADPLDHGAYLDSIHAEIGPDGLNEFRLGIIRDINREDWLRPTYFGLARTALQSIVGNELVMQRRVNLSIQLPGDDGSLLPIHCDVWAGDSPFEVVLWVPLVDCAETKSMFLVPPQANSEIQSRLSEFSARSSEDLFAEVEPHLEWIKIRYGEALLFNQNLMHGNRVNETSETRWSMNCRFKGAFTPYAEKNLGEFFEPITLRAASRIGLSYELPDGFDN